MVANIKPYPSAPLSYDVEAIITRRVFIRDLIVDAEIGIHEFERGRQQRVRINVDVIVNASRPHGDQIDNVVCYEQLANGIRALIEQGHVNLVETLADQIIDLVLLHPDALEATIKVEKLDALAMANSVGIEITRRKLL